MGQLKPVNPSFSSCMVGGSFRVESTPGKGTTICAQLPVTNGKGK
jgi:signal transduction histidine kinase